MRIVVGLVGLVLASAPRHAHAELPPLEPIEKTEPPEPIDEPVASYRLTMLATDGVAVGLLTVGLFTETTPLIGVGASAMIVGGPFIHMTKQRFGRTAGSAALRIGLPLLGLVIADSLPRDCGPTNDCITQPPPAIYLGLGAGVLVASALDAIFLAKGDAPTRPAWAPVATPTSGGVALGVVGQF